jgi:hypothetical protein
MDHDLVVRQQMTEKYLLGELEPDARLKFEEHFFDCSECALDVRAGDLFVQQAKGVLAADTVPVSSKMPATAPVLVVRGWFAWLRPAFAGPALALLLVVVGYQNLVTYPQLQRALNRPRVPSFASLNVGTWGSGGPTISIRPGDGFSLFVRIPPDGYSSHAAELYNPAGKPEWSVTIPMTSAQDQWLVQVPGANREPGTYILVVRGLSSAGDGKEVGRSSFELQIQK